jgi:two-component system nitrogen regulation sensor histidine kinase GlnL
MDPTPPTLDQLASPIAWTDPQRRLVGANPAFASWLGVGLRRLVGLRLEDLDPGGGRFAGLLARLPAGGEAPPLMARRVGLAFPGGAERFADCWLVPLADGALRLECAPADEFPGEDPSIALPSALHAALKGLAHELRNPLAGMRGAAQLLARRVEGAEAAELTGLIRDEVDRLTALLERLVNPAPARPFVPVNLHAVLERVRLLADAEAGWSLKIERDYDPSLPELPGDLDRLVQALWNLVRNALESGAGTVWLRTRAERQLPIAGVTHRLVLRVDIVDDGRGVPDDLTERLFLPLVSGRAQGSGLGLPLAQQIAREHGGALSYRSRPGHTVFTMLLPVPQGEAGPEADAAADLPAPTPEPRDADA